MSSAEHTEQFRDNELFCAFLALIALSRNYSTNSALNISEHPREKLIYHAHNINPTASKIQTNSLTTHNKEHILSQHLMNTWQPQVVHNVIWINPRNPEVHSVEHNIKFFCLCHKNNNSLIQLNAATACYASVNQTLTK